MTRPRLTIIACALCIIVGVIIAGRGAPNGDRLSETRTSHPSRFDRIVNQEIRYRTRVTARRIVALAHDVPIPEPRRHRRRGSNMSWDSVKDCIAKGESGGSYTADNPSPNSTASGKYQAIDGTWGGYGGYHRAKDAPAEVQEQHARELWNGGKGSSHWDAQRHCW